MTREQFEEIMVRDLEASIIPAKKESYYQWISGVHYRTQRYARDKLNQGVVSYAIYKYQNHYEMSVYYSSVSKHICLNFQTEDEAYEMLYRFIFMPDTLDLQKIRPQEEKIVQGSLSDMTVEEANQIKNDLKKLDKEILEGDECTKGEKLIYRFVSFVTKLVLPFLPKE